MILQSFPYQAGHAHEVHHPFVMGITWEGRVGTVSLQFCVESLIRLDKMCMDEFGTRSCFEDGASHAAATSSYPWFHERLNGMLDTLMGLSAHSQKSPIMMGKRYTWPRNFVHTFCRCDWVLLYRNDEHQSWI
eukprot:3871481-Amphidinium_carterae.1